MKTHVKRDLDSGEHSRVERTASNRGHALTVNEVKYLAHESESDGQCDLRPLRDHRYGQDYLDDLQFPSDSKRLSHHVLSCEGIS